VSDVITKWWNKMFFFIICHCHHWNPELTVNFAIFAAIQPRFYHFLAAKKLYQPYWRWRRRQYFIFGVQNFINVASEMYQSGMMRMGSRPQASRVHGILRYIELKTYQATLIRRLRYIDKTAQTYYVRTTHFYRRHRRMPVLSSLWAA